MEFTTVLSTTIAALLTLAIFSFLYKDNPFYRFAEHLTVGVSAGYWLVLLIHTLLIPDIYRPIARGEWLVYIPTLIGLMMYGRVAKSTSWLSRYPLAMYLGAATGVAIPLEMKAKVIEQLNGSVTLISYAHTAVATPLGIINNVLILIGVMTALIYFFFSKEHKGATGVAAKVGIFTLMIGFGAAFGFTVMARVSLLIERMQFLLFEWLHWT